MKNKGVAILLLLYTTFNLLTHPSFAEGIALRKPKTFPVVELSKKKTPLLQGKWFISLPKTAGIAESDDDAHPHTDTGELERTAVHFWLGHRGYWFTIEEYFAFATPNFKHDFEKNGLSRLKKYPSSGSFEIYRIIQPLDLDYSSDPCDKDRAFLIAPDRTVSMVSLSSRPGEKDPTEKCRPHSKLMDLFLKTISYGKPAWSLKARNHGIRVGYYGGFLSLELPFGWFKSVQHRESRHVYKFIELASFGQVPNIIGIDFKHTEDDHGNNIQKVQNIKDVVMGQRVIWHRWNEKNKDGQEVVHQDTIIILPDGFLREESKAFPARLFLEAANEKELSRLQYLVKNLN